MNFMKKLFLSGSLALAIDISTDFLPKQKKSLDSLVNSSFISQNAYASGDGSDEPGFVPPPTTILPPPPSAQISSAETTVPYPGPPVTPQARSEKKRPPQPPIILTKLKVGNDFKYWCATPNDINNLLKRIKQTINLDYSMEVKSLGQISSDPESNPILFLTGHYHFQFDDTQRDILRKYMLKGGTLILNTGLGSKPFCDSARFELEKIFPEIPLRKLGTDHPVFGSYYDLQQPKYRKGAGRLGINLSQPNLEGITIDCRTPAFLSPVCMAVGFEENENEDYPAYSSDYAQKLGINMIYYAKTQRAWLRDFIEQMQFLDENKSNAGKLAIAQIIYDGEWKTRHKGLSVLLNTFNQKTEIPVKYNIKEIRLTDKELPDSPLIYMTGHESFSFSQQEREALKIYIKNGGTLFAEACCGRKAFNESFKREISITFGDLRQIPLENILFQNPNIVGQAEVTPALASKTKKPLIRPILLGIEKERRYPIIYSPAGLSGGWEFSPNPYSLGYNAVDALNIGQNVLFYSLIK
ncbi:DUF4159 domain-containing protein [Candidatus Pacearchaeota archaeon]|nr:DUF4159 domain-containing protein [Candidatus Pacearchaeota archaeon]